MVGREGRLNKHMQSLGTQTNDLQQASFPPYALLSLLERSNLESWRETHEKRQRGQRDAAAGRGHLSLHRAEQASLQPQTMMGAPSAVQRTEILKVLIRPAHCPEKGNACLITGFLSRGLHPRLPATFPPGQSWKPQPEGQASPVPGQHAKLSLAAIWSPIPPNVCNRP